MKYEDCDDFTAQVHNVDVVFAQSVCDRSRLNYWVAFNIDPGLKIGDTMVLTVKGVVFGCVEVDAVVKCTCGQCYPWTVHWNSSSFEPVN